MFGQCLEAPENITFATNVMVHVLILFTFLTLFYFMYVSDLSQKAFNKEIEHLVHNASKKQLAQNSSSIDYIKQYINTDGLMAKYAKQDPTVACNNSWLRTSVAMFIMSMLLAIILMVAIPYYYYGSCVPIKHIVLENLKIFAFIGVVEFLFFTKVAFKYIPVKPSVMVSSFYSSLANRFSK